MPRQIRAQVLYIAELEWIAFAFELLNDPGLVCNGLRNDGIGDELVGNHGLFLVDAAVGAEYAVTAEVQMRSEVVVVLHFVRFVRDGAPQIIIVNPAKQVEGAKHSPQFAKRPVEFIATTVAIEAGQYPRRCDATALDGKGHA